MSHEAIYRQTVPGNLNEETFQFAHHFLWERELQVEECPLCCLNVPCAFGCPQEARKQLSCVTRPYVDDLQPESKIVLSLGKMTKGLLG